jgi:hypothetical protein
VDKLELDDDMTVDWVWISLLALWQRWWPDRPGLELLDDKMQAGYARDAEFRAVEFYSRGRDSSVLSPIAAQGRPRLEPSRAFRVTDRYRPFSRP